MLALFALHIPRALTRPLLLEVTKIWPRQKRDQDQHDVDTHDEPNRFMPGPSMIEPIALQEGEAFCWELSLRLTARRSA
jgi:hypothetical protein